MSEYGLGALVVGGVGAAALKLAKMGLIAKFSTKILLFLVAFKKIAIGGAIALFAFLRRFLAWLSGRRKQAAGSPPLTDGRQEPSGQEHAGGQ